jgi:hypothetical protein
MDFPRVVAGWQLDLLEYVAQFLGIGQFSI